MFPYLFCLAGAAWAICVIDIKVVYYGDLGGFVSACCLFAVLFEKRPSEASTMLWLYPTRLSYPYTFDYNEYFCFVPFSLSFSHIPYIFSTYSQID